MVHRQLQREGFSQLADEIICSWLVTLPELLQSRTVQKGGVPDPVRNLHPKILLLQETGQRGRISKIHAIEWGESRVWERMQHARNHRLANVLCSDLPLYNVRILHESIRQPC